MSGSSGGGGGPSINRPNPNEDCADLVINTNLASPQANVISKLKKGEMLDIRAVTDQGPIQAFNKRGAVAGTIVSREQVRLLNCINQGTSFQAEVLSVENGQCRIQIRAL